MNEREIALYILMDIFKLDAYNNIALRNALNAHPDMRNVKRLLLQKL